MLPPPVSVSAPSLARHAPEFHGLRSMVSLYQQKFPAPQKIPGHSTLLSNILVLTYPAQVAKNRSSSYNNNSYSSYLIEDNTRLNCTD